MCENKYEMSFILGIDGGGSKTTAAVSDGVSVRATHTAGGCNLNAISIGDARRALGDAVQGALAASGVSANAVSSVCAGVAGAASPSVAAQIEGILREFLPHSSIRVVGDIMIALEAMFAGGPGLVCIADSGSIAFGRNERGEIARAGGWGRLVSDEGSSQWIGQRAISQCLRALDTGRSSILVSGVMEHWRIVTREQLVQRCHAEPVPNFSDLFPIVLAAAEASDLLAGEIITSAGIELGRLAQIVLRRLWAGRAGVDVAISGGVFDNSSRVRQTFANVIRAERPEVRVRYGECEAVNGALYLADQAMPSSAAG
jgi:N-acetylglucosamine kinase-like BadF-type ATPase